MTKDERDAIRERAVAMDTEEISESIAQWDIAHIFNDLERRCKKADALEQELKQLAIKYLGLVEAE